MRDMNNILVPVDFSASSINALRYSVEMAELSGSKLTILHAYRLAQPKSIEKLSPGQELKRIILEKINDEIESLKSNILVDKKVNYDVQANVGFVEDVINSIINYDSIDLIVMGATGAEQSPNIFGSTLSTVIDVIDVPVLVVPNEVNFNIFKTVLIASQSEGQTDLNPSGVSKFASLISAPSDMEIEYKDISELIFDYHDTQPNDLIKLERKDFKLLNRQLQKQTGTHLTVPVLIVN